MKYYEKPVITDECIEIEDIVLQSFEDFEEADE